MGKPDSDGPWLNRKARKLNRVNQGSIGLIGRPAGKPQITFPRPTIHHTMAGGKKPRTTCGLCPSCKSKRKCTNPLTNPLGVSAGSLLPVAAPDAVMPLLSAEVENRQPESRTQADAELPPSAVVQLQPVIQTRPPLREVQMVEAPLQTRAPPPVHPAVSFEVVPQTPQPQTSSSKRKSTDNPMTMQQLRPRVVELPPIYGDHADRAVVLATPILARFVDTDAFTACDLIDLALFGGRYIHEDGQWLEAVMPLITQIETKIRGLPTCA